MSSPRLTGRIGSTVYLNTSFYKDGVQAAPYAIRRIDIYKGSIKEENKVEEIAIVDPDDPSYPSPLQQQDADSDGVIESGEYILPWLAGQELDMDIYFDVWYFLPEPLGTGGDINDETLWFKCCNQFWLRDGGWFCTDNLTSLQFKFEQLTTKFYKPELKWFEVGIMPLPLYDFDQNKSIPAILMSNATITVETNNCELLVDNVPMICGLRQGSYRTNPFVFKHKLDTTAFLVGNYRSRVTMNLPDGTRQTSPWMHFSVA